MAAIQTVSGNNRCPASLGHVVSGISESGVVTNVGVDVEIASPSLSVQKAFLLPGCVVAILRFPCWPTSGHAVSSISESGMVENVCRGSRCNRVAISFRLNVISTSGFQPAILNSGSRHRPRPCTMLGLSTAMRFRHDQMLMHDVPAKNSASWK